MCGVVGGAHIGTQRAVLWGAHIGAQRAVLWGHSTLCPYGLSCNGFVAQTLYVHTQRILVFSKTLSRVSVAGSLLLFIIA